MSVKTDKQKTCSIRADQPPVRFRRRNIRSAAESWRLDRFGKVLRLQMRLLHGAWRWHILLSLDRPHESSFTLISQLSWRAMVLVVKLFGTTSTCCAECESSVGVGVCMCLWFVESITRGHSRIAKGKSRLRIQTKTIRATQNFQIKPDQCMPVIAVNFAIMIEKITPWKLAD